MFKAFFSLIIFTVLLISFCQIKAQNIWETGADPRGGDIRAFAYVAPHLHAANDGGFYRSAYNGETWPIPKDGLDGYNVSDLRSASDGSLFAELLTLQTLNIAGCLKGFVAHTQEGYIFQHKKCF